MAASMRMTKIVCTLGPATDSVDVLRRMAKAGMNVARLNFSHGEYAEHEARINMVKQVRRELGLPISIMLDTKGPEIRLRTFESGTVFLEEGATFTLTTEQIEGNSERVSVSYPYLPQKLKEGNTLLINDGLIELCVVSTTKTEVVCKVVVGGELSNRKSINIPDVEIDMPYLSEIDRQDILFGVKAGIEYIAASFVRSADDVRQIRELLISSGGREVEIISKIENRQGVNNIDEILARSDGIMVARGDMGVEIPFEELPYIQKELIKRCYRAGKKVITATQMLESMIASSRPTRAEVSDVANAVFDGTSATMLSGETAVGKNPVQVIRTMAKVAATAEQKIHYKKRFDEYVFEAEDVTDAVSHAACALAHDLNAKAVIVVTRTGITARRISRFRPAVPIIAATTSEEGYLKLGMSWGVCPVRAVVQPDTDSLLRHAADCALSTGLVKKGDLAVICAGVPVGNSGNTNLLKAEII